jgi:protein-S-isoprenylcysteine O-methyltransferase Ste14
MSLTAKSLLSVVVLTFAVGVMIFAAAGTVDYWQAWVYLFIFTIASLLITLYLIKRDRELLERRLHGGPRAEKRSTQRIIMYFTSLAFIALMLVPALDRRFAWSNVPLYLVIAGEILVVIGFYCIFVVYRENTYTSATIEVATNQKVIDTGPYAVVRHPLYATALFYVLGTPLALGSYWGLVPALSLIPLLMWRLSDEEKMLVRELEGYGEYRSRVRYRLVPGIW